MKGQRAWKVMYVECLYPDILNDKRCREQATLCDKS